MSRFHYETGGLLAAGLVGRTILEEIGTARFDGVWVDQGRFVGPSLIRRLHASHGPVIVHNLDGPFAKRDRLSWLLFRRAVPSYDLVVVPRRSDLERARSFGANSVRFMFRTADEVAHAPRDLTAAEFDRWKSQVIFVGTAIPRESRGEFLLQLLKKKVPVSIVGNSWQRLPEWKDLEPIWKGPGTVTDEEYSGAILASKVALGFLSRQNDDLHTTRSVEIPALGGLFCAERTSEHLELYTDGEEAVFWSGVEECAESCLKLIADEPLRNRIAQQGHLRCLRNGHYNEPFFRTVLGEVFGR